MNELKKVLQSLSPLTDAEFEHSKKSLKSVRLKKGDFWLREGEVCRYMSFVDLGILRTFYRNKKAEEITHCFRSRGVFISAYKSFILQEPSSLSIIALEDAALTVISHGDLLKLYSTIPAWQTIGRVLAEQAYIEMEAYASVLNHESAQEKYQRLIREQPAVLQKSNIEDIASYLGVTSRTLSRIRKALTSKDK